MIVPDIRKKSLESLIPTQFLKLLLLAVTVVAVAATLAALLDKLSQNRFQRKVLACVDSVERAMPTMRRACELYTAEHEHDKDDIAF